MRDLRLPLVALVSWVTILVAIAHLTVAIVIITLGGLAISVLVFTGRWRRHRGAVTALWVMAALALVATSAHHALRTPDALTDPAGAESVRLVVVNDTTIAEGDRRLAGVRILQAGDTPVARVSATLFFEPSSKRLPPGTTLSIVGDISPTQAMDVKAWRFFASEMDILAPAPAVLAGADAMRKAFLERSLGLGGDGGALLPGLALGDTQGVSASLEADMRAAALAHLVAVSGANCALVVGIAVCPDRATGWWCAHAFCGGCAHSRGLCHFGHPGAQCGSRCGDGEYCGWRVVWGRPSAGLAVLALTVWILLLADPWRAVEFAFVLSVAATAGIVLGLEPAATALSRLMPRWLAWFVGLPLVAQLAVQPIIILLRPTLPTYGIAANVLAAPFVPVRHGVGSGWKCQRATRACRFRTRCSHRMVAIVSDRRHRPRGLARALDGVALGGRTRGSGGGHRALSDPVVGDALPISRPRPDRRLGDRRGGEWFGDGSASGEPIECAVPVADCSVRRRTG